MSSDYQATVREIITENQYLTLATTDGEQPWVASVQFCCDDNLDFYFISLPTSRHAGTRRRSPGVAEAAVPGRPARRPLRSVRGARTRKGHPARGASGGLP